MAINCAFLGTNVDEMNEDVEDAIGESFYVIGIADAKRIIVPLKRADATFWLELIYVVNA